MSSDVFTVFFFVRFFISGNLLSSLETCYLLWKLVIFSGVLLSFLEPRLLPWSCCLLWSLIIFSGASLPSLESHLLSWSVPLPELLCVC